jgi:hypothetical protein
MVRKQSYHEKTADPDPDPIYQQEKKRKTLISTIIFFLLLFVFLSLKTDVNVPSKSNERKKFMKKT